MKVISLLCIFAVKRSLGPFQATTLDTAIASNRAGFAALLWRPESPILLHHTSLGDTMRFESHFKSSFGNVKAFNLKKLKL